MYRPIDFKNPYSAYDESGYIGNTCGFGCEYQAFEAGADEMLRCLEKMPVKVRWKGDGEGGVVIDIDPAPVIDKWHSYMLVFIPEDK